MSKNVRLKMNARDGSLSLQCSEAFYETAMEQCLNIISAYHEVGPLLNDKTSIHSEGIKESKKPKGDDVIPDASSKETEKPKRQRSVSGKAPNYTQVDLGLSDEQCRALKSFYEEKQPQNQNDTVCIIAFKLKEFLGRNEFSVDDIFSGLRIVGGVSIPRNLLAVFKNISYKGYGVYGNSKFTANFATEDYVNLELPARKKE